jgi:PhnB protein
MSVTTKPNKTDIPGAVRPVPEGYHTVTPFVIVKGAAQLIDFMKEAFGGVEIARVTGEDGAIGHAEVRIGDSVVMMFDAKEEWPETPAFLRLYVEDCDATYQQALKAGATSVTKPTNMPWGDRVGRVRDPLGNLWWIMTRIEDVDEAEIEKRAGEKEYIDALQYVQSAEFFPPR